MTEDFDGMIEAETDHMNRLRAQREQSISNYREFAQAFAASIQKIDAAIQDKANAIAHLESLRQGRPPLTRPQAPINPTSGAATPAREAMTPEAQMAELRERARRGEFVGLMPDGRGGQRPITIADLPDPGRVPASFQTQAPDHAVNVQGVKFWEGPGNPEWSPADVIDEHGKRHVLRNGRHKVFDSVTGALLSDEPAAQNGTTQAGAH